VSEARAKRALASLVAPLALFFVARALVGRARRRVRAFLEASWWALRGVLVLATFRRWRCELCCSTGRRRTRDCCARCWRLGMSG
jgi:hypothetical protein